MKSTEKSTSTYWLVRLNNNQSYLAILQWETRTLRSLRFYVDGLPKYEIFSKSTSKPITPTLLPEAFCYKGV